MADLGRESENIRWSFPTNRPIFSRTENEKTNQNPMNPAAKKRVDLEVALPQFKKHTGSALVKQDISRDPLGKFHKDKRLCIRVCIRARRRVLQCIAY